MGWCGGGARSSRRSTTSRSSTASPVRQVSGSSVRSACSRLAAPMSSTVGGAPRGSRRARDGCSDASGDAVARHPVHRRARAPAAPARGPTCWSNAGAKRNTRRPIVASTPWPGIRGTASRDAARSARGRTRPDRPQQGNGGEALAGAASSPGRRPPVSQPRAVVRGHPGRASERAIELLCVLVVVALPTGSAHTVAMASGTQATAGSSPIGGRSRSTRRSPSPRLVCSARATVSSETSYGRGGRRFGSRQRVAA